MAVTGGRLAMLAVLAFLLHTMAGAPEPALPRPGLLVSVRTEGRHALDADTLVRITTAVQELWRPYAEIRFTAWGSEARLPRHGDELELVITDRTLPARDAGSLGWIEFVNGRPARIITVSTTAARTLMEGSSWNGRPLTNLPLAVRRTFLAGALSRSIAHEIGHYLLGSREHAVRGLMRASFAASDVLEPRRVNDRLDAGDVRKIHRQLLELASTADLQPPVD
jgi:hypothetical protein